jgi:hypothetical protein
VNKAAPCEELNIAAWNLSYPPHLEIRGAIEKIMFFPNGMVFVNLRLFRYFETVTNIRTWIKSHGY